MSLWSIFITVLFAELGDKTQLATLLFAADPQVSRVGVFCASAGALVLSSFLAVLVGGQLSAVVSPRIPKIVARIGFVVIGGWMLFEVRS
jgi:putative Ca2+/H+ antiporter (TMEM165/GDT1 family)